MVLNCIALEVFLIFCSLYNWGWLARLDAVVFGSDLCCVLVLVNT